MLSYVCPNFGGQSFFWVGRHQIQFLVWYSARIHLFFIRIWIRPDWTESESLKFLNFSSHKQVNKIQFCCTLGFLLPFLPLIYVCESIVKDWVEYRTLICIGNSVRGREKSFFFTACFATNSHVIIRIRFGQTKGLGRIRILLKRAEYRLRLPPFLKNRTGRWGGREQKGAVYDAKGVEPHKMMQKGGATHAMARRLKE